MAEDISQPPQPPPNGKEDRPRNPRRSFPSYPESPIVISPERVEAAKDALAKVHELWEQGRHLDSLLEWFDLPKDKRDDAINSVILQEAQLDPERSLRSAQYETEGKPENLILQHYALFSTDAVGKIIRPDKSEPITEKDIDDLGGNPGSNNQFMDKLRSLGLRSLPLFHDMDDFIEPKADIQRNFSLEETRQLLVKLLPHLSQLRDKAKHSILGAHGLVSVIKYADLLADPRLTDALEIPFLKQIFWEISLENYISQEVFPSAEFFEETFKRLDPKDSDPNANFHISHKDFRDTEVPASVFYFTMLRRIVSIKSLRDERHPEYGKGWEEKIMSYLLNDAFMQHVLPYLETENAYEDNFVHGSGRTTLYNAEVKATGEEAKALKRERLGEVIKTAIEYARQKGDEQTVQKLTEREVGGVKFADFLN